MTNGHQVANVDSSTVVDRLVMALQFICLDEMHSGWLFSV